MYSNSNEKLEPHWKAYKKTQHLMCRQLNLQVNDVNLNAKNIGLQ